MTKVKVLSLFSGAGGLDLGLERAGMEVVALCEIDPKARAVLRKHWPATRIYEDVREVSRERLERDGISAPHFVAGGSPCQDLSVAGKRRGLDGSRSGLFWEQCRIADELEADILWENVPGALSSNGGADFAAVLWGITGALVELPDGAKWPKAGVLVGPKRTAVWRVADAQRFGVPQRRRRVYVVGCAGAVARRLAPLLLEFQGGEGNRAAGREAGTRAARTVADSSDDACGPRAGRTGAVGRGDDGSQRVGVTHAADVLTADLRNGIVSDSVTGTLMAHKVSYSVNAMPHVVQEPQAFVKAKRASSNTDDDTWRDEPVSPTLNAFDNGGDTRATVLMVQPTEPTAFFPSKFAGYDEGVGTLRARDAKGDANIVVQGTIANALTANMAGARGGADDNAAQAHHLIAVRVGQSPAGEADTAAPTGEAVLPIGFSHTQGLDPQASVKVFPTLRAEGGGHAVAYMPTAAVPIQDGRDIDKAQNGLGIGQPGDPMYTLDTTGAQSVAYEQVALPALVRMREGKPGGGKGPLISEQMSLTIACGNDQILFHDNPLGEHRVD